MSFSVGISGDELINETRIELLDGTLNLLISHPLHRLAAVTATTDGSDRAKDNLPLVKLPFELYTPESL